MTIEYFKPSIKKNMNVDDLIDMGIKLKKDHNTEFTLDHDPYSYSESIVSVNRDTDEITFSYLTIDDCCDEYDFQEGCIFETFNNQREKNKRRKELKSDGYYVYSVEEYRHSGSAFALENEGNFPDRRWDVSPNSLIGLDKDYTHPKKSARSIIEIYNKYLSGEVYGLCSETYSLITGEQINSEAHWGYIGLDESNEELMLENGSPNDKKENFIKTIKPYINKDGIVTKDTFYHTLKKGSGLKEIQEHFKLYINGANFNKDDLDKITKRKRK